MDKLEELEKKILELEKKLNQSNNMFGRAYSLIGNSDSDFLIKTRGQVKIQYGSKFIDLIKNGKINTDSKFIYSVSSIDDITKDGIYHTEDGKIYIKFHNQDPIVLPEGSDEVFVSYSPQENTNEQKQQALINIGLVCDTFNDIPEIQNGFVYVSEEDKLYIINRETIKEYYATLENPLTVLLVINQNSLDGAIVLKNNRKENGLHFGDCWLYDENGIVLESSSKIRFIINNKEVFSINSNGFDNLYVNSIQSSNFNDSNGFQLKNGILILDKVIERNKEFEKLNDMFIFFHQANILDYSDESDEENKFIFLLTIDSDKFNMGDSICIFTDAIDENEDEEGKIISSTPIIQYIGTIIDYTEPEPDDEDSDSDSEPEPEPEPELEPDDNSNLDDDSEENTGLYNIYVKFDREINENLTGKRIYITEKENLKALYIKNNSIEFDDLFIGYLNDELISVLPNALTNQELELTDNSKKFATTEWVNKKILSENIPSGIIVLIEEDSEIPEGWSKYNNETFNNLQFIIKN